MEGGRDLEEGNLAGEGREEAEEEEKKKERELQVVVVNGREGGEE